MVEYHRIMKSGIDQPNLNDFEITIRNLCESVATLPKGQADKFQKPMAKLGQELSDLAAQLEKRKDEVEKQIEGLEYNRKAQIAYKVADNLAKPREEK